MKKILIINNYISVKGGNDSAFINMANYLSQQNGLEVHSLTSQVDYSESSLSNQVIKHIIKLPRFKSFKSILLSLFNPFVYFNFKKLDKINKFDHVIIHTVNSFLTFSFLLAINGSRTKVTLVHHDYYFVCPKRNMFNNNAICQLCVEKNTFQLLKTNCQGNIFNSLHKFVEYFFNFKILKIHKRIDENIYVSLFASNIIKLKGKVIKNIYQSNSKDKEIPEKKTVNKVITVGFLGRMVPEKGIQLLKEIAKINKNISFVIAGKNASEETWSENVQTNNNVTPFNLHLFFKEIDFLIVPSIWYENMPMVILEAFSFGVPCIVNPIGGLTEMIEDGVNGIYLEPTLSLKRLHELDYIELSNASLRSFELLEKKAKQDLLNYTC